MATDICSSPICNDGPALQDKKTYFVQAEAVHIEREELIAGV